MTELSQQFKKKITVFVTTKVGSKKEEGSGKKGGRWDP